MTLQDIKEKNVTNGRTEGQHENSILTHKQFAGGIHCIVFIAAIMSKKIF